AVKEGPSPDPGLPAAHQESEAGPQPTIGYEELEKILQKAKEQGQNPAAGGATARAGRGASPAGKAKARVPVPKGTAWADDLPARLRHLCGLIVRDRRPFCPLNGILVLIPFAGTDRSENAQNVAEFCRRDLATVQEVFRTHCPIFTLICDMERCPG